MSKLYASFLRLLLVISGWNIGRSDCAFVSSELCQYIQRLIKRFEEDNGKCVIFNMTLSCLKSQEYI